MVASKGELLLKGHKTEQDIYVVEELSKWLLGLPAIKTFNLKKQVQTLKEDFKCLYPTVFFWQTFFCFYNKNNPQGVLLSILVIVSRVERFQLSATLLLVKQLGD